MHNTGTVYDVIVLGAGPAGLAAFLILHEAGLSTLLVDQAPTNQLKVGESIPGAAIRMLNRLSIASIDDLLSPEEYLPSTANASAWGSEEWTFQDAISNPEGGGWHVLRHRFDKQLRQHVFNLGMNHCEGMVNRFVQEEGLFRLQLKGQEQTLQSRWLIDATGRKAIVARKLGGKRKRLSEQYAVVSWTRAGTEDQDKTTRVKSVAEGWWYTSPLPGNLRVSAFQVLPKYAADLVKSPEAYVEALNASGLLPNVLRSADLVQPLMATDAGVHLSGSIYGAAWLAVGDAALSFDPLSSQGIFFALYSGIRGAEAVINSIQNPDDKEEHLQDYAQKVRNVFEANQRSREMFYSTEFRFLESEYWRAQCQVIERQNSPFTTSLKSP